MSDCTHGPPTPCAGCRVRWFVEQWALFTEPFKPHHAEECESGLRNLMKAHAAAARREAFEEAARLAEKWSGDLIVKVLRARAAEEGSDG